MGVVSCPCFTGGIIIAVYSFPISSGSMTQLPPCRLTVHHPHTPTPSNPPLKSTPQTNKNQSSTNLTRRPLPTLLPNPSIPLLKHNLPHNHRHALLLILFLLKHIRADDRRDERLCRADLVLQAGPDLCGAEGRRGLGRVDRGGVGERDCYHFRGRVGMRWVWLREVGSGKCLMKCSRNEAAG